MEKMMMKRNVSDEKLLMRERKEKKNKMRILITINVLGSTGPLRFVVKEDAVVAGVIDTALKIYSTQGRLPLLGLSSNNVFLYSQNATSHALNPWETIGSHGERNFVLCKKQQQPQMTEARSEMTSRKISGWKAWLTKSFTLRKILPH